MKIGDLVWLAKPQHVCVNCRIISFDKNTVVLLNNGEILFVPLNTVFPAYEMAALSLVGK